MAFGRLERTPGPRPMADINMTPLIDVMLVLLVIFMITAPLMGTSLKLDLPQAAGTQPNEAPSPLTVNIDAEGRTFIGDQPLSANAFSQRLADAAHADPEAEVQLRADKRVPYGRVAEVLGLIQQAGLSRIAFVAEPPHGANDAR